MTVDSVAASVEIVGQKFILDSAIEEQARMKKIYLNTWMISILIAAVYIIMTTLSFLRYPGSFSPSTNWLSDLGNRILNTQGAIYYNTGIYLTGGLLGLYFIALGYSRIQGLKVQNLMLLLTQGFGIIGSIAMILTGIFSIDTPQPHSLFSAILRICLGTAFGFSVAAFRYHKGIKIWILIIGIVTTLLDLLVSLFFDKTQLLEWPVIALFLTYCLLLGREADRLGKIRKAEL